MFRDKGTWGKCLRTADNCGFMQEVEYGNDPPPGGMGYTAFCHPRLKFLGAPLRCLFAYGHVTELAFDEADPCQ